MIRRALLLVAVLLATLPVLAAAARVAGAVAPDLLLRDRDHESLGKTLSTWIDSLTNPRANSAEARQSIHDELEKWRRKRELKDREPLSLTEDIGRALWLSNEYTKARNIRRGRLTDIEIKTRESVPREISYALHAPSRYRAQDGPYPLIFCIPDEGEKLSTHLAERWAHSEIRDNAILVAVPMPEKEEEWPGETGTANFFTVFGDVTRTYAVDFDRIYVAGRGKGVDAATTLGWRFPDRFAGIIGRTGDTKAARPENFRNLPSLFAGSGKGATELAEACKAAGHDNVTILPEGKEEDVWAWMQQHARHANPDEVVLLPGTPIPRRAYWVEVPALDATEGAVLRARIDRAENRITIDAKGIPEVTLYLNDVLVDLDRDVKVVCNGVEHIDRIPRNLTVLLETIQAFRSDPGKIYTTYKRYDLPASD